MKEKSKLRKEEGFTLIEIIAVLVLLGILAIVAIPKFLGLQDDAKNKATLAAVAEGGVRVVQVGAKLLLQNGTIATNAEIITELDSDPESSDAGDFSIDYSVLGTSFVHVLAVGRVTTDVEGGSDSRDFGIPQS